MGYQFLTWLISRQARSREASRLSKQVHTFGMPHMYVWRAEALIHAFDKILYFHTWRHASHWSDRRHWQFSISIRNCIWKVEQSRSIMLSRKRQKLRAHTWRFGWNDIGDWKVVYDLRVKNDVGNVILTDDQKGQVVCHDSHIILVAYSWQMDRLGRDARYRGRRYGEILLVMPREKSQDVKRLSKNQNRLSWIFVIYSYDHVLWTKKDLRSSRRAGTPHHFFSYLDTHTLFNRFGFKWSDHLFSSTW